MAIGVYFAMTWIAGGASASNLVSLGVSPRTLIVLVNFGANFRALVLSGDLWRLVTSIFLHWNLLHLALNAYALFVLGRNLEAFYGPWILLALFLLSGVGGSVASVAFSDSISAGASGGVFGLLGASLVFAYRHRGVLPTHVTRIMGTALLPWVILNLVLGFIVPHIDMAAHLGGLVSGAALAWFLRPEALVEASGLVPQPPRLLVSFTLSLLFVSFASAGTNIFRMRGESGPLLDPRMIQTLGEVDRAEALRAIEEALEQSPHDTSLLLARATVYTLGRDWENAIADYRAVLEATPGDYRALNNLAWLLLEEAPAQYRDREDATRLAERAVAAAPNDPYSAGTLGTARLRAGDAQGAIALLTRALAAPRPAAAEATDRYLLATSLAKAGRTKEATEALRVAVQQDPGSDYRSEAERAVAGSTQRDSAS